MLKVMIVDDEHMVLTGLKTVFNWTALGFEMAGEAKNGEQAAAMIESLKPDVVITDVRMPKMDGLELSRLVKEKYPDIEIIILSGYDEFKYAKNAMEIGVNHYLLKPVEKNELINALRKTAKKIEARKNMESEYANLKREVPGERRYDNLQDPAQNEQKNQIMRNAIDYININYSRNITLEEVAESVFISRNYLCNLFKKELGENFVEYLTHIRIEKAGEYLKSPEYKTYEIAKMVGYSDYNYFSQVFRRIKGMTPTEYRNSSAHHR